MPEEFKSTLKGTVKCAGCGEEVARYRVALGKGDYCLRCYKVTFISKSTFPFVTSNISGDPVTVQSLHHLRQLEAAHGVNSFAYNYDRPESREQFEP